MSIPYKSECCLPIYTSCNFITDVNYCREVIDRPVEVPVPYDREVIREVPVREEVRVPVEVPVEIEKPIHIPIEVPVYIQSEPEVRYVNTDSTEDI